MPYVLYNNKNRLHPLHPPPLKIPSKIRKHKKDEQDKGAEDEHKKRDDIWSFEGAVREGVQ